MTRNHEVFVRLDDSYRAAALGAADYRRVLLVTCWINLDAQELQSLAYLGTHRGSMLADPSGKHHSVESTQNCRKGSDEFPHSTAEHLYGLRGCGIGVALFQQRLHVAGTAGNAEQP